MDTETDQDGPERTETDFRGYQDGLYGYRNGFKWIGKRTILVQNRDLGA